MLFRFDGREPVFGKDTYISETAIVLGGVTIGQRCYIGHGSILRGDYGTIEIEDEVIIEEGVIVHAPPNEICRIERGVVIGHGAIVHARIIKERAFVGMGAILSLRSEIGKGSIVGEGSVVRQKEILGDNGVYVGNPIKRIRNVKDEEKEYMIFVNETYTNLAKKYIEKGIERLDV